MPPKLHKKNDELHDPCSPRRVGRFAIIHVCQQKINNVYSSEAAPLVIIRWLIDYLCWFINRQFIIEKFLHNTNIMNIFPLSKFITCFSEGRRAGGTAAMCVVSTLLSCSPPCLPPLPAASRSLLSRQSVTRSPECWSNPSPGHVTTQQPGHSCSRGNASPSRAELSRAHIVLLQIFVSWAATILTRARTEG